MKPLMTIGERIAWRLNKLGYSPYDAAKAIGYTASYIYQLISNNKDAKSVSADFAIKIAKYMRVDLEWLISGKSTCEISIVKGPEQRRISDNPDSSILSRYIPIITWHEAATLTIKSILDIPERKGRPKVPDMTKTGLNNYALPMQGDSMIDFSNKEESFRDGLMLYFDPTIRPYIGTYVLARDTKQNIAYFRKLTLDCGQVYLTANNYHSYPAIHWEKHMIINGVLVDTHRRFEHVFNPAELVKEKIKFLDDLV